MAWRVNLPGERFSETNTAMPAKLTPQQVAKIIGISPEQLRKLKIPGEHRTPGNQRRYWANREFLEYVCERATPKPRKVAQSVAAYDGQPVVARAARWSANITRSVEGLSLRDAKLFLAELAPILALRDKLQKKLGRRPKTPLPPRGSSL
jgi:hypothetical protein